jgi:hypothetical protein
MRWNRQQIFTVEQNTALKRVVNSTHDVEHRRLTSAVWSDQPADVTLFNDKGQSIERNDATETNRHIANI